MKQCSTPVLLNFNSTTDLQQNGYFANQSNNMVDVTLHLMLGHTFFFFILDYITLNIINILCQGQALVMIDTESIKREKEMNDYKTNVTEKQSSLLPSSTYLLISNWLSF